MTDERNFASASVPRHLARGVAGFGALIGAIALLPVVGAFSLLLAPVGLLALRGCPTCWAIGLAQTVSRGRLQRSCADGRCRLTTGRAEHATADRPLDSAVSLSADRGIADRSPRDFSARD
ncbi:hypothetical protein [Nocardia araoensis]|uniref:hypothetical protein n=1 Tax=Nocardia araoensis TaxID=228600 RepID=UPI00031E583D|nr:hypothetical protein [Nocardia araoensis]